MAATNDTKYISLTGLGHFLNKLRDSNTNDDCIGTNAINPGVESIHSGIILGSSSEPMDYTGLGNSAYDSSCAHGLSLSNSVLKSRGREVNWESLESSNSPNGHKNLDYFISPGVYTINGYNNANYTIDIQLPYSISRGGKFQVRLTVTRVLTESTDNKYEKVIQHIDYIDSRGNYGIFMRSGSREYAKTKDPGMAELFDWTTWNNLATNTTYGVATTTSNGLMSSADKSKLDGIAANANNYTHPSAGSNTGSFGQSANKILTYGGTFSVPYVTVDANGHVTSISSKTLTMPSTNSSGGSIAISTATMDTLGGVIAGFYIGSDVSVNNTEVEGKYYAVGINEMGTAVVNVPWEDTKVKSTTSTSKRYLLGHSSTATTATANTNAKCYMSGGYLYSNGKKVDMENISGGGTGGSKMSVVVNESEEFTSPITLAANTCTHLTYDGIPEMELSLGDGIVDEVTTHMVCFRSDGMTIVHLPEGVLWLDGEQPPFIMYDEEGGTDNALPAGFYEFIFTKYGNENNLSGDNRNPALVTASWAAYR